MNVLKCRWTSIAKQWKSELLHLPKIDFSELENATENAYTSISAPLDFKMPWWGGGGGAGPQPPLAARTFGDRNVPRLALKSGYGPECSFNAQVLILTKTEKRREGDGANTWGLNILLAKTGWTICRRGSRINTDRFPKRALKAQTFSGVQGLAPPRNYLDFYSSKSPFLGFWGLSAGTGKLCIFGHLGLVFIWSCFVSCLLLLLYYVICAPVLTEGTGFWVIQMGYWPGFNLESVFIFKIYFIWKMWPISVKRWKPVWIRTWSVKLLSSGSWSLKIWSGPRKLVANF